MPSYSTQCPNSSASGIKLSFSSDLVADCSKLENQQAVTIDHSSKDILLNSFVPNLTVQTFVSYFKWQVKFAAISAVQYFQLCN